MLTLLFDGTCGFCTRSVEWIKAHDPEGRIDAIPSQAPDAIARHGLTRADVAGAVWAIDRHGRRFHSAAAASQVLLALGGPWRAVGALYAVPPLAWLAELGYWLVARNRHHLSRLWGTVPACERPGAVCV